MNERKLHVALHDVAPKHLARAKRAEKLLASLGVEKATFLAVPDFHHEGRSDLAEPFVEWCRGPHPFEIEWALHGYFHVEENAPAGGSARERFDRAWMTGGEGEFLALPAEEAETRLREGVRVYESIFGAAPAHFVPPAWLWHEDLPRALAAAGIRSFEAHKGLCAVGPEGGQEWLLAPVISWATRTLARRIGSLYVCPALAFLWRETRLLRVALHPFDFDWSSTQASIEKVLKAQLEAREQVSLAEALDPLVRAPSRS